MTTDPERITALESDARLACHERAEMAKSVKELCKEIEKDRESRHGYDAMMFKLMHGKDTDNPGVILELDRLKLWKNRVASHVNWIWCLLSGVMVAIFGAVVTWVLKSISGHVH